MKLISNLHAAHQIMRAEVAKHTDLTPTQALVLATLDGQEGISQTDICNKAPIDRSTLADTVRRLLKSGHLTRKRTRTDARRYAVTLTTLGRKAVAELTAAERDINAGISAQVRGADKLAVLPIAAE